MMHLSERLVNRPVAVLFFGSAMLGVSALLRSTPIGVPFGVLAAGIGFAMAGLGLMLKIGDLAEGSLDARHSLERFRARMAGAIPQLPRSGHHAH